MKKFGYTLLLLASPVACLITGDTEGAIMTGVFMSPLILLLMLVRDETSTNKKRI